jgi:hypothetical protein
VAVAPVNPDRIATDGLDLQRMDVLWHRRDVQPGFARPLVDAMGARTSEPKPAYRISAFQPVGPGDSELAGARLFEPDRPCRRGVVHHGGILALTRIIHDPSSRGHRECPRLVALGLEGPEGVAVATSRDPRAAFGCQALATRSVAAEGEGREDWVLAVSAAEGFMNNAG